MRSTRLRSSFLTLLAVIVVAFGALPIGASAQQDLGGIDPGLDVMDWNGCEVVADEALVQFEPGVGQGSCVFEELAVVVLAKQGQVVRALLEYLGFRMGLGRGIDRLGKGSLDAALAVNDPDNDTFGYLSMPQALDPLPFVLQHGGNILDDLQEPTRTTYDDPLTIDAVEWYADLVFEHNVIPTPEQMRAAFPGDDGVYRGVVRGEAGPPPPTP